MKEVIYSNRYRDQIKFEIVDKKTIKMTGYSDYFRYGFPNNEDGTSNTNVINMVDPSGGPYLEAGQDMKWFFTRKRKPMIIKEFEIKKDYIIIKIK